MQIFLLFLFPEFHLYILMDPLILFNIYWKL